MFAGRNPLVSEVIMYCRILMMFLWCVYRRWLDWRRKIYQLLHLWLVLVTPPVSSVSHSIHMYTSCSMWQWYSSIQVLMTLLMWRGCWKMSMTGSLSVWSWDYSTLHWRGYRKSSRVISKCNTEILAAWLQQQENVAKKGIPFCWKQLSWNCWEWTSWWDHHLMVS